MTGQKAPELTVVVVAYNSAAAITATVDAAEKSTAHLNSELIVVDNGSVDDTYAAVKRSLLRGRIVRLESNVGYGRAVNEGVRRARGELLLIMNDDILLTEECVDELIGAFRELSDVGMVGAKVVDRAGQGLPSFRRFLPGWRDEFERVLSLVGRDRRHTLFPIEGTTVDVGLVLAACALTNTELFRGAGGFNSIFFLYGEDIDFCRRLQNMGLRRRIVATAVATHDQEISPERRPRGRQFMDRIMTARDNYYRIWLSRPARMIINAYRAFGVSDQPARFKFHISRALTGGSSLPNLRRPPPLEPTSD